MIFLILLSADNMMHFVDFLSVDSMMHFWFFLLQIAGYIFGSLLCR